MDQTNHNSFQLNQKAFSTKQMGRPLSTYYGDLMEIFQELDHRDRTEMKDMDDVITYRRSVERLRVHIFLNGLDAEFEQIQGEILRKDLILDLKEAYAYVHRDVVRRVTLNNEVGAGHVESSAMMARRAKPRIYRSTGPTIEKIRTSETQNISYEIRKAKSEYVCTHCGETGHTKLKCNELIGYPEWWDPAKAPRKRNLKPNTHALIAVAEHPSTNIMSSLMTKEESVAEHPSTFNKEESGKVFHTSTPSSINEWIIDFGATDHITFDKLCLQYVKPLEQYCHNLNLGSMQM